MKYKIYYYKTYIGREKGYVGCTMDIKQRHSVHKTTNKGILDEPEILATTDCILEARELEDKFHYDLLGVVNKTPYVDNRSHIYKQPNLIIKPKIYNMKLKELTAIRIMATSMGYDTNNITVDQTIQLYNIIKPALDKTLIINEEWSDFEGIDTSEI